ncbi:replication factor A protein 1 [Cyclospora cayetanensis]|uniref:Replication factor A protein 1 n=1 Tax=Cyclospora cayetanensis TaxID=88456 RepID=A0A6P6RRX0_9EIME|nr:replication factor A protein 1 [Cyclospora cayetanensis]
MYVCPSDPEGSSAWKAVLVFVFIEFSTPLTPIKALEATEVGSVVSIVGVLYDFKDVQTITLRVLSSHDGGVSVCLTLWGSRVHCLTPEQFAAKPIVLIRSKAAIFPEACAVSVQEARGKAEAELAVCVAAAAASVRSCELHGFPRADAKVGEWGGKKLEWQSSTRLDTAVDLPDAKRLALWWSQAGSNCASFAALGGGVGGPGRNEPLKTLEKISQEAAQADPAQLAEKGLFFSTVATIERVADDRFSWPACPDCRKKMQQPQDGDPSTLWLCSSCNKQSPEPVQTYLLNLTLADATGSLRASLIGERAEGLMAPLKAGQLVAMQLQQTLDSAGRSFHDVFTDVNLTECLLKLRAASETYLDESRIKFRVISLEPLQPRLRELTTGNISIVEHMLHALKLDFCLCVPLHWRVHACVCEGGVWAGEKKLSAGRSPE